MMVLNISEGIYKPWKYFPSKYNDYVILIIAGAASDDLKFEAKPDTDITTFPLRICTARIYDVSPIRGY